ncbi:MAG: hypothetical protein NXI31_10870 [bacterium]|nr:hypothetical protein [bacterium]
MSGYHYVLPLACVCVLASATTQCHRDTTAEPPRIAAVGASVTAGFRLSDFLSVDTKNPHEHAGKLLGRKLSPTEYRDGVDSVRPGDVLAKVYRSEVDTFADTFLFVSPESKARAVLTKAFRNELDLVVGIDLMFWFGYGKPQGHAAGSPEAREWRLDRQTRGFALLDKFCQAHPQTTFVLGDYPDLTGAVPLMIQKNMIPTTEERQELNDRLADWATERKQVHVFELSKALDRLRSGEVRLTVGEDARVVAEDAAFQLARVHPNRLGVAVLIRDLVTFLGKHLDPRLRPDEVDEQVIVSACGVK